jgi:glycosyltransferase involved in cell wall biosynthesis
MPKGYFINLEGAQVQIRPRGFKDYHGITMCCVILNEEKYIVDFLNYYRPYVDAIVMVDGGSSDRTIELATPIVDAIQIHKFDGHYSNQANRAFEMAKTDWVLLVDYDERIEKPCLESIRDLINQEEVDCWAFPRKNFLDGKYDSEHYPDYQDRLHRAYCRRVRPVHGEVVGVKCRRELPCTDGNFMIHSKTSERHKLRNGGYNFYEFKHSNELGGPGTQTEESFYKKYPHLRREAFGL